MWTKHCYSYVWSNYANLDRRSLTLKKNLFLQSVQTECHFNFISGNIFNQKRSLESTHVSQQMEVSKNYFTVLLLSIFYQSYCLSIDENYVENNSRQKRASTKLTIIEKVSFYQNLCFYSSRYSRNTRRSYCNYYSFQQKSRRRYTNCGKNALSGIL